MARISTQTFYQSGLSGLLERQEAITRAREQIQTGRRIITPADDPSGATQVLELNDVASQLDQFRRNGDLARVRLEQQESALINVSNALQRARELAIQGRSEQLIAADRAFLAEEVDQLRQELVSLGNTRDSNGDYLFAGFRASTQPFTVGAGSVVTYNGDQGQRRLRISSDRDLPDADNGFDVFMAVRNGNGTFQVTPNPANTGDGVIDPGSLVDPLVYQPDDFRIVFTSATTYDVINDSTATTIVTGATYVDGESISFNGIQTAITRAPDTGDEFAFSPSINQSMFTTMENLRTTLGTELANDTVKAEFGNDMARVLTELDRAIEQVLEVRTATGARLKAIDGQEIINQDLGLRLQEARSEIEDTDLAEVSVILNTEITALEAAQLALARVQNLSLFSLL